MRSSLAMLGAVLLVACGSAGSPNDGRASSVAQRIVGGSPSTSAHDAVVMLQLADGFCTGTLIAPTLVITARHCLAAVNENAGQCGTFGANVAPSTIGVAVGVQASANSPLVSHGKRIFTETGTDGCGTDIGLVELDTPVNEPIAKVRLTPPVAGEGASTAGYGDSGNGQVTSGRYERAGLKIDAVGPTSATYRTRQGQSMSYDVAQAELATGESTCFGDSGGPLFDAQGAIIGVTSRGIDGSCVDRPSIYSGTAGHAQLINAALTAVGAPTGSTSGGGGSSSSSSTNDDPSSDDDTSSSDDSSISGSGSASGSGARTSTSRVVRNQAATQSCAFGAGGNGGGAWLFVALALGLARRARRR